MRVSCVENIYEDTELDSIIALGILTCINHVFVLPQKPLGYQNATLAPLS